MSTGPQMGSSFSPSSPFSFLVFPQVAAGKLSDLPRHFIHSVRIRRAEIREASGRVRDSASWKCVRGGTKSTRAVIARL